MLETIAALCVVLGVVVLLRWTLVRLGIAPAGRSGGRRIQVVESVAIGAKQQLHLVEIDGRSLLLGASETGIARLARLPDVEAVKSGVAGKGTEKGRPAVRACCRS